MNGLNGGVEEVAPGILRLTFPLPLGIDHVHCYFLAGRTGGWTIVDTAITLPGARERWESALASLDEPVERVFVTHFHPDHVGGSELVAQLTGAPVLQGRVDYEYCERAWGHAQSRERSVEHLREQGMPREEAETVGEHHDLLSAAVLFRRDPQLVDPGDQVGDWEAMHLPGHADGHLALVRDVMLVAGDALLGDVTSNVGIYPGSRPDPLGDYLDSLERIEALRPQLAFPGHGEVIRDPAARAREIAEHHRERLDLAVAALDSRPRTAYDVSLELFPDRLPPSVRRMALAETLAHLEHLALRGRVERVRADGTRAYRR